jgi:hypothetical protein
MKWEHLHGDWGFILLMILIVLVWGYAVSSCSTVDKCGQPHCVESNHGPCPWHPNSYGR